MTGKILRFKLRASNEIGSTLSASYLSVLMARTPGKPSELLQLIQTTSELIKVQIPLITDDGGSTILAFELVMDDGLQG